MPYPGPFSTQFLVYTSSTPNTSYEVPEGFVAVVRDCTLYDGGFAAIAAIGLQNSAEAPLCNFALLQGVGVPVWEQWTGRVVVPAGGFIIIDTESLGLGSELYVGGYLLRA